MPGPTREDRLIGEQRETIARLERENTSQQQRINRAIRDLDHVAAKTDGYLREFALESQVRLRGVR